MQTWGETLIMTYLLLLLQVLPFSLAIPQWGVLPTSVTTWGTSAPPGSTTIPQWGDLPTSVTTWGTSAPPGSTTIPVGVIATVSPAPKPTSQEDEIPRLVRVNCSDPSWVPSVDAWMREEVDRKLKEWWESVPSRTSKNFVSEFGKAFGDFEHNLACGVDTEDQCVNPSCEGLFYILFLRSILGYLF